MLSLFPQILFLAPFSALLIRIALAVLFAAAAWRHASHDAALTRSWGVVEAIIAAALFVGAWTQAFALLGGVLILVGMYFPRVHIHNRTVASLALVLCLSLLVTGAGALAFDLPL
ncbi:MAG: hypothetical protein WC050_03205 [Candidatus Paceibacterota bacterium]